MSINVITAVCNSIGAKHTAALFGALRSIGRWEGDILLFAIDMSNEEVDYFEKRGIKVYTIVKYYPWNNKYKLNVFLSLVRIWDKVLYLDADHVIKGDINTVFENNEGTCFISENKPLWQQIFNEYSIELFGNLPSICNMGADSFCAGTILFDSEIVKHNDQTKHEILNICQYIPLEKVYNDQPLLNVYFCEKWNNLKGVSLVNDAPDSVALHTTHWHAPWSPATTYHSEYLSGLRFFEDMK